MYWSLVPLEITGYFYALIILSVWNNGVSLHSHKPGVANKCSLLNHVKEILVLEIRNKYVLKRIKFGFSNPIILSQM